MEKPRHTIHDYFRLEHIATEKHEFCDGEILAMSGGSVRHSLIAANLTRAFGNALKDKPCRVFDSNLRTRMFDVNRVVYPDITVICGPVEVDRDDRHGETILNPRVVVEVLSPSTERYDRTIKFDGYRSIPSLQEYVLVSQDHPRVEVFRRLPDGSWSFDAATGTEAVINIRCLAVQLPLSEIYAGADLTPEPTPLETKPPQ